MNVLLSQTRSIGEANDSNIPAAVSSIFLSNSGEMSHIVVVIEVIEDDTADNASAYKYTI